MEIFCRIFGHRWQMYLDGNYQVRYCIHCKKVERLIRYDNNWVWVCCAVIKDNIKRYLASLTKAPK